MSSFVLWSRVLWEEDHNDYSLQWNLFYHRGGIIRPASFLQRHHQVASHLWTSAWPSSDVAFFESMYSSKTRVSVIVQLYLRIWTSDNSSLGILCCRIISSSVCLSVLSPSAGVDIVGYPPPSYVRRAGRIGCLRVFNVLRWQRKASVSYCALTTYRPYSVYLLSTISYKLIYHLFYQLSSTNILTSFVHLLVHDSRIRQSLKTVYQTHCIAMER